MGFNYVAGDISRYFTPGIRWSGSPRRKGVRSSRRRSHCSRSANCGIAPNCRSGSPFSPQEALVPADLVRRCGDDFDVAARSRPTIARATAPQLQATTNTASPAQVTPARSSIPVRCICPRSACIITRPGCTPPRSAGSCRPIPSAMARHKLVCLHPQ